MKILLLIILSIALGFSSSQNADDVEIQKTLDLLDEGQRHIELNEHRDVVLILGNTGSEKSTFLQWILGDNSKLIAVEVEEGKFIIQDGNVCIGSSNIESKTLIPELVMDNSTNSAYYDCPGFSDTRSTSHEVATTYFIKRVADHAQRIKLVFIVGHSSVSEGNDKLDFMKLLTHATELVRDVDKFGNSVALVATKVISIFKGIRNGKAEFTSDASVINDVGKFLLKTKEDLVNDHSKAKFVQLLDSFLLKNRDNSYARIGIFRRPMIAGPLSENEDLLKAKEHIVEILNNLRFRVKNAEDFGYTVSDRSKNEIANFIHAIGITVENHLDKLVKTALGEFEKSVLKVESQLEAFESEDSSKVKANEEIEKLESVLNLGLKTISKLANDVKAVNNPRQLVEIIRSAFSHLQWLDVSAISDTLKVIDKQGDYFNFFQVVSKQTFLISNSWAAKWQKAAEEMTNLKSSFKRFISSFVDKVGDEVGHLLYQVERVSYDYHKAAFDGMKERITIYLNNVNESLYFYEISKMKRDFEESVKATSSLIEYVKNENDLTRLNEKFVESVGEIFVKEKISTKMKRLLYFLNSLNIDGKMRKSWAEVLGKKVRKMSDLNRNFDAFVNSASDLTNSVINSTIANLTRMTRDYFENIGERVHGEVNSYVKGSISSSDPFRVQKLVNKLSEGHSAISKLSADSVNAKHALELTEKIANFSSSLHLKFLYPQVTNVAFQLRNLALLLEIQEKAFVMPVEWLRTLRDASDALRRLENSYRTDIFGLTINFKKTIGGLINDVGQSIERYYEKIVDEMEYKLELLVNGERLDRNEGRIFRDNFMLGIDSVSALVKYIKALTNVTTLAEEISQSASEMRVKLSAGLVENIESKCVYLNYLLIVSDETVDVGDSRWAGPLEHTFRRLSGVRDKFKQSSSILISAEESNIETSIANFSQCLHEYYREKLNRVKTETKYFTQNSPSREADVLKARELASNLNSALGLMSNVSASIGLLKDPLALKNIINDVISKINGFCLRENFVENLAIQVENLDFLSLASNAEFKTPKQWIFPIKNAGYHFDSYFKDFMENSLLATWNTVYDLIKADLDALAQKIILYYEDKISNDETDDLSDILSTAESAILDLLTRNKIVDDLFSYLTNVVGYIKEISSDKTDVNKSLKRYEYLEYMRAFRENQSIITAKPLISIDPFAKVVKFLKESYVWYPFLSQLDEKLSEYKIQSDVTRYDVANLDDWGIENRAQGLLIDNSNFKQFINKLDISGGISSVEITASRIIAIDKVLANTLRSKDEEVIDESANKITLQGRFIKFSDFLDENRSFRYPSKFISRNVSIFASKTLFIDRSLSVIGTQLNLSIIAPQWEVIETQSITLDGADQLFRYPRAKDGERPGEKGEDGKAGLPGGSAGNVFGLGKVFINGERLYLSAIGGKGGRGQDGGHGHDGKDGDFVKFDEIDNSKFRTSITIALEKSVDDIYDRADSYGYTARCKSSCDKPGYGGCMCRVEGKRGGKGGDGGKGGAGGAVGRSGRVELVETGERASGIYVRRFDQVGERGSGGAGGQGGKSQDIEVQYTENKFTIAFEKIRRVEFTNRGRIPETAERGRNGS